MYWDLLASLAPLHELSVLLKWRARFWELELPKIKRRNNAPVVFCHSILGLEFPVSEANENSSELLRVRPIAPVQLMPSIPSPSTYQGSFEKGAKAKLSPMACSPELSSHWINQLNTAQVLGYTKTMSTKGTFWVETSEWSKKRRNSSTGSQVSTVQEAHSER